MSNTTRRHFLAAAGGAALTARAWGQVSGANERLRVGVIGCGGMAGGHMRSLVRNKERDNVEIVAVCDLYDKRAEQAAQVTGGKIVKDYRRVLEQKEIDYVLIATPEHWHCPITLDALDANKHVYVEKPMTQTVEESKKVLARLKTSDRKLQVGVQGMSDDSYEAANEYVKNGTLGKVVLAQIDYSRNHKDNYWAYPIDEDAKPGVNLDWKTWLGNRPKRPWDPNRFFRWRWYWDYSGGIASDLFVHRVTRIIKALGLTYPEKGVATGGKFQFTDSAAEVPDTFNVLLDYPGGPTVQLVSSMANDTSVDHVLRGHKATLEFTRTGFVIRPQELYMNEVKPVEFRKTGAENIELHHRNLMNAIRKNEALKCDAQLGYYGVVACEMGVQSYRQRRYLAWDSGRGRVTKA
ncbi:MAG TPA: gfo/Idh/MocA family oxidoreductase [Solibacterales bacterium]|nr:gfo/Idh/MocA family oxidoreductase [Bryobacterales bacterium]